MTVGVAIQGGSSCAIGWLPDTGADVDAISLTDLNGIDPSLRMNLVPDTADVQAANGTALDSIGKLEAQLSFERHYHRVDSARILAAEDASAEQGHVHAVAASRGWMASLPSKCHKAWQTSPSLQSKHPKSQTRQ